MKKIGLLLLGLLTMFSCEQEEMDDFVKSDLGQVQTRATSSIADFDPILELDGILVRIRNVGNTSRRYLSCVKSGTTVDLFTKDDGSGRQQWIIKNGRTIILPKGNNSISSDRYLVAAADNWSNLMVPKNPNNISLYSIFSNIGGAGLPGFWFKGLNNGNLLIQTGNGAFPVTDYYLKSESSTSSTLKFSTDNSTTLSQWHIDLIGECELVDLEYVMTPTDKFVPTQIVSDRDEYTNHSSSVQTWHYVVKSSVTESSNYSETQGVSISFTRGITVGLPNLLEDGGNVTVNNSIQQQSSRTWNFGQNKAVTNEKTRTGDIPVQPGETISLDAVLTTYKGTLTYVATLRKVGETKTFRMKGKWEGDCFSMFKAKTYSSATGKFLKEYILK